MYIHGFCLLIVWVNPSGLPSAHHFLTLKCEENCDVCSQRCPKRPPLPPAFQPKVQIPQQAQTALHPLLRLAKRTDLGRKRHQKKKQRRGHNFASGSPACKRSRHLLGTLAPRVPSQGIILGCTLHPNRIDGLCSPRKTPVARRHCKRPLLFCGGGLLLRDN